MSRTPTFVTPVIVGGAFLTAAKLAPHIGDRFWLVVAIVGAVMVIALAAILGFSVRSLDWGHALRILSAPLFLAASAYCFLLLVETTRGRYVLTFGVMAALATYVEQLRIALRLRRHSDFRAVEHIAHPLRLVGLFFLLAFLFGVNAFVQFPVAFRALIVGLSTAMVAAPAFGAPLTRKQTLVIAGGFGLALAELFSAFALLPVTNLPSAAALTLLFSGVLHLAKYPFTAGETPKHAHRSFSTSVAMTALVLATAQWI